MSPEAVYTLMSMRYGSPESALDQLLSQVEEYDQAFLMGKPVDVESRSVAQQLYNLVNAVYVERVMRNG